MDEDSRKALFSRAGGTERELDGHPKRNPSPAHCLQTCAHVIFRFGTSQSLSVIGQLRAVRAALRTGPSSLRMSSFSGT